MTDEQFQKMYAVEVCKLHALVGIEHAVTALARKQGVTGTAVNWEDLGKLLASAVRNVEPRQPAEGRPQPK